MKRFVLLCVALLATTVTANDRGWKSSREACPESCTLNSDPFEWNVYPNAARLSHCNQTMLMETHFHTPLDDPNAQTSIYACTAQDGLSPAGAASRSSCEGLFDETPINFKMGSKRPIDSEISAAQSQVLDVIDSATTYLAFSSNCAGSHIFGTSQKAATGLYVGDAIQNAGAADSIMSAFEKQLSQPLGQEMVLQHCGTTAKDTFGVAVNMDGDLAAVQRLVQTWSQGGCASGFDQELQIPGSLLIAKPVSKQPDGLTTRSNQCRTIKVAYGDSCGSLAARCGISDHQFTKYNPNKNLCSSLASGQEVCCSPGSPPNLSHHMNADGSCYTYKLNSRDTCSSLAVSNGIPQSDIEKYNQNTWGWMGCKNLMQGQNICLSPGKPPFPAPLSNAVCGPQVPGTKEPTNTTLPWRDLNACPLYACCDTWGQCGIDPNFCEKKNSPTGAPGTEGCIAFCGYDLVNDPAFVQNQPKSYFYNVGYYEGWNMQRSCKSMDKMPPHMIPPGLSHVHYAFGDISPDFKPQIKYQEQTVFDEFLLMTGFYRIITFGGWAFSTGPSTYMIFREGVKPANREKFAQNIANFIVKHNLDGVDFDWEYPGAPDIPGIPPGSKDEGQQYYEFLSHLRKILPSDKTISVAVPASYWYLKNYPILEMVSVVDYWVFMTYDLSGSWDLGRKWSQPGCPGGNCLRSDVNLTQTYYDLNMITTAVGSESSIVVGTTSYGRSFEMAQPGCWKEECHYTAAGKPGPCTQTKGFLSNAEIDYILANPMEYPGAKHHFSADSDSDILVYDKNQWVGYLSQTSKKSRRNYYERLGFRGTADWAIDLSSTWESMGCGAKAANDITMPPKQVWAELKCDKAWADAIRSWEQQEPRWDNGNAQFSEVISSYFHGPQNVKCAELADQNGCGNNAGSSSCNQFNSPAGWMIMQSFENLDATYLAMWDGITHAQSDVVGLSSELANTFAPHRSSKMAKLGIDILNLGLALFLSPCWNKIWKDVAKQAKWENELGTVKDWVNPAISQSLTIAKDMMKSGVSIEISRQDSVQTAATHISNHWEQALGNTTQQMFNGSSNSINWLYTLIKDGQALGQGPIKTNQQWKQWFETALFTIIIPELWNLKNEYPFILPFKKMKCPNGQLPHHSTYWWTQSQHLGISLQGIPWYCYQDQIYLLVRPDSSGQGHYGGKFLTSLNAVSGAGQLDGSKWGGITGQQIMRSCIKAYEKNGNQNGWNRANPLGDPSSLDNIIQWGTSAAGVWPFPVCSQNEALNNYQNWLDGKGMSKHFPCD